jgi:hypothetical protein
MPEEETTPVEEFRCPDCGEAIAYAVTAENDKPVMRRDSNITVVSVGGWLVHRCETRDSQDRPAQNHRS